MTPEQRRIFDSKPIGQMRRFAGLLHWLDLRLEHILFSDQEIAKWNVPRSGIITYYSTTDIKFNLQINELGTTTPFTHQASIQAFRYGIRDIGWHPFTFVGDEKHLQAEAERLRSWLARNFYKNRQWLSNLKREHPELLLPTRKRRQRRKFST